MKTIWKSLADRPHIRAVLGPDAVVEGDVKAWPIPANITHAQLCDRRVLFIGDAARACDVLTGEGIGQAIQTGSYAAEAILADNSVRSTKSSRIPTKGSRVQVRDSAQSLSGGAMADPTIEPLADPTVDPTVDPLADPFADPTVAAICAHYESAVRSHLGPDHHMAFALQRLMRSKVVCRASLAISGSTNWTRSNFARWLFEDYARGIALTPRRWRRGLMSGRGAYLNK